MGKPQRERALKDNEARAVARLMRVSPQKLNLLAQLIRGKKVDRALADLTFSRKRIAKDVKKTLAVGHRQRREQSQPRRRRARRRRGLRRQEYGDEAHAPRARGRAGRIEKPFAQMTMVVRQVEEPA